MNKKLRKKLARIARTNIAVGLIAVAILADNNIKFVNKNDELIFIGPKVIRTEELINSLPHNAEIIFLDKNKSGIEQISQYLAPREDIESIRIISHGNDGYFALNNEVVNNNFITKNSQQISSWKDALTEDADIMLYGCNIAATDEGKNFVRQLAELTGADVAAATKEVGGLLANWTLDYKAGDIETVALKIDGYEFHLATYTVNSNADAGSGTGNSGDLRYCITQANGAAGDDEIIFALSSGNETITLGTALPALSTNIDINGDNTAGSGTDVTVQANEAANTATYRVFNISSAATVALSNMTIKNGKVTSDGGGGIYNAGTLSLENCTVSDNKGEGVNGGGIQNDGYGTNVGTLSISNSIISNNTIDNYSGGGIYNSGTISSISNSTISGNSASFGGGISLSYGDITSVSNSTISGNTASAQGGGIHSYQSTITSISNSTISGNTATGHGGGIYGYMYGNFDLISNSTISGNTANDDGGGIFNNGSEITLENSTIANNHANNDDAGTSKGGGIYTYDGTLNIKNTIIAGNYLGSGTATGDDYYYSSGTFTDNGYNIVEISNVAANATGGFNSATDILYNTVNGDGTTTHTAWNKGGTDLTGTPALGLSSSLADNNTLNESQTLALSSGSFAINAGTSGTDTDQRGAFRVDATDIGAYEYHTADWMGWTGNTSTAWVTTTNWSSGSMPTTQDVSIPGSRPNYPAVSGSTLRTANTMDIASGASLTIEDDGSLTLSGDLTNSGTLTVESNSSTNTGSLIVEGTATGDATVERFVTSAAWHLVSPSTTGVTSNNFFIDDTHDSWLTEFSESTGTNGEWSYITSLTQALDVGSGYSYWIDGTSPNTVEFTGSLQATDLVQTLAFTTGGNHGWNSLGNPFASALDWDESTWSKTNTTGAAYVWSHSLTGYVTTNGTGAGTLTDGIIPTGQGFFVRTTTGGTFTIAAAARVHSTQAFYKSKEKDEASMYVRIDLDAGNLGNTVFIGFPENGTDEFDFAGDADKLFSTDEAIQMFAIENDKDLCINANAPLTEESNTKTVPLHLVQVIDGSYTLSISQLDQLPDTKITLEDLKTGTIHNFNENTVYSFTASENDDAQRFLLHFGWSPDGIDEDAENASNINIYSYGNEIYIRSSEEAINQKANVFVYDMLGREILSTQIHGNQLEKIKVNVENAYVVVKVVKDGFVETRNVFIK